MSEWSYMTETSEPNPELYLLGRVLPAVIQRLSLHQVYDYNLVARVSLNIVRTALSTMAAPPAESEP